MLDVITLRKHIMLAADKLILYRSYLSATKSVPIIKIKPAIYYEAKYIELTLPPRVMASREVVDAFSIDILCHLTLGLSLSGSYHH